MIKNTYLLFLLLLFGITGSMAQTVQIGTVVKAPGDITVPVNMTGFTGSNGSVQSIQLQISFDAGLLYFKGITNIDPNFSVWVISANGTSSPITLSYVNLTGHDINAKIFDLKFGYAGGFSGNINFIPAGCEISGNGTLTAMNNVTYINGSVSQTPADATVNLGAAQQASVTSQVLVPVNMQGTGLTPFSAFTFKIGYDPAKLTFMQTANTVLGGTLVSNAVSGVLTVTWTGTVNSLSDPHVFDLKFTYNGGGNAPIEFKPGSQITNSSLALIPTTYTNGLVQNLPGSSTISIPNESAALNSNVSVPITLNYTGSGYIGGVTLKIGYNSSIMTFTGTTSGLISGYITSVAGGEINIIWTNSASTSILSGSPLLNLKFTAIANGTSPLTFNAGTTVTQTNLSNVVLTYNNGSVAIGTYNVSGRLKYANVSGPARPITNSTVLLKTADGLTTLQTTTTDASGNYTFSNVSNGNYKLDASTTKSWCGSVGVNLNDYAIVRGFVNTGTPVLTGIFLLAADVNNNSTVNLNDYALIRNYANTSSLTGWYTPGWIFLPTTLTILNANATNMDIIGICLADVNASYIPPL